MNNKLLYGREEFLAAYSTYCESTDRIYQEVLLIRKLPVDVYELWAAVNQQGGHAKVQSKKLWAATARRFNHPKSWTNASHYFKTTYESAGLLDMEELIDRGEIELSQYAPGGMRYNPQWRQQQQQHRIQQQQQGVYPVGLPPDPMVPFEQQQQQQPMDPFTGAAAAAAIMMDPMSGFPGMQQQQQQQFGGLGYPPAAQQQQQQQLGRLSSSSGGSSVTGGGVVGIRLAVKCGTAHGVFDLGRQRAICLCVGCSGSSNGSGVEMMPTEFERHGGCGSFKKWKKSILVEETGRNIGSWLIAHGLEILSPSAITKKAKKRQMAAEAAAAAAVGATNMVGSDPAVAAAAAAAGSSGHEPRVRGSRTVTGSQTITPFHMHNSGGDGGWQQQQQQQQQQQPQLVSYSSGGNTMHLPTAAAIALAAAVRSRSSSNGLQLQQDMQNQASRPQITTSQFGFEQSHQQQQQLQQQLDWHDGHPAHAAAAAGGNLPFDAVMQVTAAAGNVWQQQQHMAAAWESQSCQQPPHDLPREDHDEVLITMDQSMSHHARSAPMTNPSDHSHMTHHHQNHHDQHQIRPSADHSQLDLDLDLNLAGSGGSLDGSDPHTAAAAAATVGSSHRLRDRAAAAALVGKRIRVWWPLDKEWYCATVQSYSSHHLLHSVLYDDGDMEQLNLLEEQWELAATKPPVTAATNTLLPTQPPQPAAAAAAAISNQPSVAAPGGFVANYADGLPAGTATMHQGQLHGYKAAEAAAAAAAAAVMDVDESDVNNVPGRSDSTAVQMQQQQTTTHDMLQPSAITDVVDDLRSPFTMDQIATAQESLDDFDDLDLSQAGESSWLTAAQRSITDRPLRVIYDSQAGLIKVVLAADLLAAELEMRRQQQQWVRQQLTQASGNNAAAGSGVKRQFDHDDAADQLTVKEQCDRRSKKLRHDGSSQDLQQQEQQQQHGVVDLESYVVTKDGYQVSYVSDPPGFEILCLIPGFSIDQVKIRAWNDGRMMIKGAQDQDQAGSHDLTVQDQDHMTVTKVLQLPARITAQSAQAVMTESGQLYVRVELSKKPIEEAITEGMTMH